MFYSYMFYNVSFQLYFLIAMVYNIRIILILPTLLNIYRVARETKRVKALKYTEHF